MSNDPRGEGGRRAPQTDGISPSTLSIVVIGLVLLIVGIGVALILRYDDEDDPDSADIPSPSGTSELVRATATATQPVAIDTSPTASDATPSPTVEETPTATANAGLTTSPTEAEIEPTATNTADVEPEPTPSEPPQPSATPEPLEGDFGFLPPAELPSGGASSTLELTYQLALSLEELPASGTVYLISWPAYSLEDVELARDRLGLEGDVIEEGVGVYRVEGESGMLFVSPTEIIFRAADSSAGGELPGESAALQIASEWASLSGFVGADADGGEVVGRDEEVARVVVKIRPTSPQPNLAPNPAATVTLGPGGEVLEARIAWPAELAASEYGYGDPVAVWQEVQAGQGFLEADLSSVFATGQLTGNATITGYSTAYTLAGSAAEEQFLVPVLVFEGTARIDQTGDEIPVFVSIPVVYHEAGTAG